MSRLLAPSRDAAILRRLESDGAVNAATVAQELGVSHETVRRDLKRLADRGRLRLVHGGAALPGGGEPPLEARETVNAEGKDRIGRAAAALVRDGMSVILDSGTTTMAVARHLDGRRGLAVYTNSLEIAALLARKPEMRVVLLGGEVQAHDASTVGFDTIVALEQYRADIAFVGVGGMTDEPAITDYTRAGAALRGRMLTSASHVVVLADRSKFGRPTPIRVPGLEKAHRLIVDRAPDIALSRKFRKLGLTLSVAS